MDLTQHLRKAKQRVLFLGTSPLAEHLLGLVDELGEVVSRDGFQSLHILYESDDELYRQSVALSHPTSSHAIFFAELIDARDYLQGLRPRILKAVEPPHTRMSAPTIAVKQVTLRIPVSMILIDEKLWLAVVTDELPELSDYLEIDESHPWRGKLMRHIDFYINPDKGGAYLFDPEVDKQLIQMYDNSNPPKPRGDAPRKAFYDNKDIQRRSVWGFVFNRDGKIVLHKRSDSTADNQGMWDKSFGGHVDTGEDSLATAKRELIEEFFLAAAEDTRHVKEDVGLVRTFGDWVAPRGSEAGLLLSYLQAAYEYIPQHAWALFIPQLKGDSNRVIHTSKRYYVVSENDWAWRSARFIADTFFLVAPQGYLLSEKDLERSLAHGTEKGAASKHRLIEVRDLLQELSSVSLDEKIFTEDLYHFTDEYRDDLLRFASFVRRIFG